MSLTKKQRTRVRRVLNNLRAPVNHLERDGIDKIFERELRDLKNIGGFIRSKAVRLGYDPEEDLPDVSKESYYR